MNPSEVLRIEARLDKVTVKNGQVRYVLIGEITEATDRLLRASGHECTIGIAIKPEVPEPNGRAL